MAVKPEPRPGVDHVAAYKTILQTVSNNRPSGTRQRLAAAIGKNRSFISQITNPAYPTPIPAQHLDAIFSICHFSPTEREAFLAAYRRAHPGRLEVVAQERPMRRVVIEMPDFGSKARNRAADEMLAEMVRRLARIALFDK
jgi:nitroreductase